MYSFIFRFSIPFKIIFDNFWNKNIFSCLFGVFRKLVKTIY